MRYLIEYFIKCRKLLGNRVYGLLFLMIIAGLIEGTSMALFLPILQTGFGDDRLSQMLKSIFNFLNVDFSAKLFLCLIMVFFILRSVFLAFYAYYSGKLTSNLLITLRRKLIGDVFSADYIYVLKKEIGYLNNAIIRELAGVVDAFRTFSAVLEYTILAFVYIVLSLIMNFKLSVILISVCPVIIFSTLKLNALVSRISLDYSYMHGKFNSILFQALSKFKYLKATLSNRRLAKIINANNEDLGAIRFRLSFLESISREIFELAVVLVVAGLLLYQVTALNKSVNEIIFLVFLFLQTARQFLTLQASYRKFLTSMGSIETFNQIVKGLEDNAEDLNVMGTEPDFDKSIILKNVTLMFSENKKALDNVNLSIKPRSVVALVGHSGSGKSTIANMVTGILKPTSGEILFGDTSYRDLNLEILRKSIGYVTQEDIIFNASIKENISLWNENVDEDRLSRVIRTAHIKNFVSDLPEKENSMLGDNGLDISGGQRQRITIARELYKEAKLLILDEATSALDTKAEKQIYENLKEFKGNKTMLVIAHRLSTIRNADYVYVLDGGKVVEEGTYDDLYDKKGEFKNMIEEQKLV